MSWDWNLIEMKIKCPPMFLILEECSSYFNTAINLMLCSYRIDGLSRKRRVCAKIMLDKGHGERFVMDLLNMKPNELEIVHNSISKESIIYKSINQRIVTRWHRESKK